MRLSHNRIPLGAAGIPPTVIEMEHKSAQLHSNRATEAPHSRKYNADGSRWMQMEAEARTRRPEDERLNERM